MLKSFMLIKKSVFFMHTSVSKNVKLVFDIWHSNLMDSCFVLSSFKSFIRSFFIASPYKKYVVNKFEIDLRTL